MLAYRPKEGDNAPETERGGRGTMSEKLEAFRRYRERMNRRILEEGTLVTRRFFNLDGRCYEGGALDAKTKEMLGLVASLVLRCDDCVTYHILRCVEEGATRRELVEVFDVGMIVGGSITIPHVRRAHEVLDEILPPAAEV
jgi:AhpD family alkylhydroperoxidase